MASRQILVACAVLAGCAAPGGPAEVRPGPNGETVHYYPQLPYGRVTYAHRYGADGQLIAIEQRLTERNTARIVRGQTTMKEVRDLLGPPWRPERYALMEREAWTYPMLIEGDPNPKWFIVQLSTADGIVRETYMMNDPQFMQPDSPGGRRP
ncbi:MAG: hypothetical protein ACT4P4_01165 [Betaproteobacteria bacterium]